MKPSTQAATLQTAAHAARALAKNIAARLPGARPAAVVVELTGHVVPRAERPRFFGLPIPGRAPAPSLEHLEGDLDALARAPWVKRVVLRIEGLRADPATAYALRRRVAALRASGKETIALLTHLDWTAYYVASAAGQIIAPESAEVGLRGLGVSITFMRDALAKIGVRFEKLAIDEYKNAFDNFVRQEMSPAQREQLEALLDRFEAHYVGAVAEARGLSYERVREIVDQGISPAERARAEKLLDRVAYEDEVIDSEHRLLSDVKRFLGARVPALGGRRVALVALTGGIITGKSRRVPIGGMGGHTAGSETLVRALRAAGADRATAAVALFVDSGGGSALASDLIGREVKRLRDKKPVVAVMGAVAASGGYYVLTHATRVIAAPTTITGSIGVLTGKLVLEDLYARWGLNAERVQRGKFALMQDPSRAYSEAERELLGRDNREVYDRFVARVAEGRRLTPERVNEIGRGRIWAGADALTIGLVDELGDLGTGIERARELGGLGPDAPVWDVPEPEELLLPSGDPDAFLASVGPVVNETSWLVLPARLRIG
jgi:protease-4